MSLGSFETSCYVSISLVVLKAGPGTLCLEIDEKHVLEDESLSFEYNTLCRQTGRSPDMMIGSVDLLLLGPFRLSLHH